MHDLASRCTEAVPEARRTMSDVLDTLNQIPTPTLKLHLIIIIVINSCRVNLGKLGKLILNIIVYLIYIVMQILSSCMYHRL